MDVEAMLWAGMYAGFFWAVLAFGLAGRAAENNAAATSSILSVVSGAALVVTTVCMILAAGWSS